MKTLIVATGNPGKLREMQEYLDSENWDLQIKPPELDIEETGSTFLENAALKASQVAIATQQWAIADDSGLAVDVLNGAPGLYSSRYGSNDQERIGRVLQELGDNPNRAAKFVCAIAIAAPDGKIVLETEGVCHGEILSECRGENGFGYDPIFFVPELGQTFAEITSETKRKISHRGKAFEQILPELKNLN